MTQIAETTETKVGTIHIRPYVDSNIPNMGFETEGIVLHDGTTHKEYLTCLEKHGVKRYLTGLDEFAPEIEHINDPTAKKNAVRQIREKVIYLEKLLAGNDRLKSDDKDFWEKVTTVRRDNHAFWKDVIIELSNEDIKLDPKNPHDLIKICAIEAGGFSEVAKSFKDARAGGLRYKFYLDKSVFTEDTKSDWKKVKNQAIALLEELSETEPKTLWCVVKNLDPNSYQYKNNTPQTAVYNALDEFINGRGIERSVSKAAKSFIETAKLPYEKLKIQAVLRDASFYKYLVTKEGHLYHSKTSTPMGKNLEDCAEYCANELNAKVWNALLAEVEQNWK